MQSRPVGHAKPGAARAVLRQPVQLGAITLPTGTELDGTADELPDGRFLLRFDFLQRPDGSVLKLDATALVNASAATRRPLTPGVGSPGFEFDLSLATAQ